MGITPYHIRMLTENPWEGGGGYTANEVGDMTLDQIFMRLVDRKTLESKSTGKGVTAKSQGVKTDDSGAVIGRAADGTPIRGRIAGESLARQLMRKQKEEEERRRQEEEKDGN